MFLHTYIPEPILFSIGPINIYWYGLLVALGIIAGLFTTIKLAKKESISQELITDLAFYLIIFSIIGARLYDVLLELPYYLEHPLSVFKVWQGGLAIHGALLAGGLTIYFFAKKKKLNFFKLAALITPGLAIGQAIGRFGNYFNQELFGLPTNLPWGIPISIFNRPENYLNSEYYHPTFLYESIGNLLIFLILVYIFQYLYKKSSNLTDKHSQLIIALYFLLYSILRFSLEFIRIDYAPQVLGWRWPQIISSILIVLSGGFILYLLTKRETNSKV